MTEELTTGKFAEFIKKGTVFIDFYADWCAACAEMALNTFADSRVRETLSQVVLVQADVTQNSPNVQALSLCSSDIPNKIIKIIKIFCLIHRGVERFDHRIECGTRGVLCDDRGPDIERADCPNR